MSSIVTIARRFCGPPQSGNGGYSSGMLASFVPGPCECTLRKPIPLERELHVESAERTARLLDGADLVIAAEQTQINIAENHKIPVKEAETAAAKSPAFQNHPFPTCFTCGPQRKEGDGLRIFPGALPESAAHQGTFAAPWIPDPSLTAGGATVRPEFVWAAMDCPTGFAAGFPWRGTLVTGRLAVQQVHPVYANRPYVVVSWPTGEEGRKFYAAAILYSEDGELCAKAKATWIKLA
jgi:hypothetical protein